MNWLARLGDDNSAEMVEPTKTTKPTKRVFVGFVGIPPDHIQKNIGSIPARDQPDEIRTSGPEQPGGTSYEIREDPLFREPRKGEQDLHPPVLGTPIERLALLTNRYLNIDDAQELVDRLALRDKQRDDRRVCLECAHMSGSPQARRCSQWRKTGMQGPPVPGELVGLLQRCQAYSAVVLAGAGIHAATKVLTTSDTLRANETAGAV